MTSQIAFVTYKEVSIFWNSTALAAQKRLNLIRKTLGKTKFHRLTVEDFCKAEDVSTELFYNRITSFYKPGKLSA